MFRGSSIRAVALADTAGPRLRFARGRAGRIIAFLGAVLAWTEGPAAPAPESAEGTFTASQIEAVYLYNLTGFVEWPVECFDRPDSPLTIGVLGTDPFGSVLDIVVRGATVNGHPIVVRRFGRVKDVEACHILFIGRSEAERVGHICASLTGRHILTVSDVTDFVHRGGIIELVEENQHVRFRIALQRARAEALIVSAKLLRAAEVVSTMDWPPSRSGLAAIPQLNPLSKFLRTK